MKFTELKDTTLTELAAKGRELRQEMFNLRLQQAKEAAESSMQINVKTEEQINDY